MTQSYSNPYGAPEGSGDANDPAASGQRQDGGYGQPAYYDTAAPSDQIFDQASDGAGTGATEAAGSGSGQSYSGDDAGRDLLDAGPVPAQTYGSAPAFDAVPAYQPPPAFGTDAAYEPAPAYEPPVQPTEQDDTPGAAQKAKDTAATAKEEAGNVKQGAAEAGQHVAGVAKDQASNVASEAATQAKDLLSQGRSEVTDQASTQQKRVATGLHSLADELHSMGHSSDQPGVASDLARQAADRSHQVASWLEDRQPGEVLQELQTFARQRPAVFLAGAAVLGLVGGRVTRGLVAAHSDETADAAPAAAITPAYDDVDPAPLSTYGNETASTFGDVTPPAATGSYYGEQTQ